MALRVNETSDSKETGIFLTSIAATHLKNVPFIWKAILVRTTVLSENLRFNR
jgi:hypothetical protein